MTDTSPSAVPVSRPAGAPTPSSAVQATALGRGELPPLEEVRDGVWSVALPFGDGIDDHSLGYVVEGDGHELAVIDPGWQTDENLTRLTSALAAIGHSVDDIAVVAVTHLHADHLGGAETIRRASGASVALHRAEQSALLTREADAMAADDDIASWGAPAELAPGLRTSWGRGRRLPELAADVLLEDGHALPLAGRRLEAVWTPGHTAGHLCFEDLTAGLLFTGDHVLPTINPGIGLGGRTASNPLVDFIASLERVVLLGGDLEAAPGHEYRFTDLVGRCTAMIEHRADRTADVADALDALDSPTVWQIAQRMRWSGGIESLSGFRLASALAQTGWHADALGRSGELRDARTPDRRA
ncbi:MBL fold metallo-hydrolase [Frigoribacterium sp. 2-23]|uniref:MBL fold metallo-hydrolase n=1 Tax=Frigoribacterium sp. 2-23 TaxID=3415006 RepID=UPI003C7043CC